LSAHLRQCPRCAHEAQLLQCLDRISAAAGENDHSRIIPLAKTRELVEQRVANAEYRAVSGERIIIRRWLPSGKAAALVCAALVVAVFFAGQLFFSGESENHIIGYEVAFAGVHKELAEDTEQICYLLWTLELPEADIDDVTCDTTCRVHIVYLQSREEAAKVIEAFSRMGNAYRTVEIIPVRAQGTQHPSG